MKSTGFFPPVSRPTNPPPCVDTLHNCAQYTDSACKAPYLQWAADNCRAFCGLCCELHCNAALPHPATL